ncbi:flagellar hook-length control protein FliK [Ferrimonas pelagia]|uniref:Flagellar hook-length control protein FliK n=1 Tax=Ferrimonas pelagia TaxID=1177826 RepID=A0ABP9EB70_9GAMM
MADFSEVLLRPEPLTTGATPSAGGESAADSEALFAGALAQAVEAGEQGGHLIGPGELAPASESRSAVTEGTDQPGQDLAAPQLNSEPEAEAGSEQLLGWLAQQTQALRVEPSAAEASAHTSASLEPEVLENEVAPQTPSKPESEHEVLPAWMADASQIERPSSAPLASDAEPVATAQMESAPAGAILTATERVAATEPMTVPASTKSVASLNIEPDEGTVRSSEAKAVSAGDKLSLEAERISTASRSVPTQSETRSGLEPSLSSGLDPRALSSSTVAEASLPQWHDEENPLAVQAKAGPATLAARAEPRMGMVADPVLSRQPIEAERMAPQLRDRLIMMVNSDKLTAEIRLDPPELGALQVRIQMNGEQAQLQIVTQQAQTRDLVEQALPRLREMLEQQGLQLADADIRQGDPQQGQSGAEGGAGEDGQIGAGDDSDEQRVSVAHRRHDGAIDYYA